MTTLTKIVRKIALKALSEPGTLVEYIDRKYPYKTGHGPQFNRVYEVIKSDTWLRLKGIDFGINPSCFKKIALKGLS